jgi:hypothetical protein
MNNKKLAIIQPSYLPWVNFFLRIIYSDEVVFLDDVEYSKNSFFNRNSISTSSGEKLLLTVPILYKNNSKKKINEIKIDNSKNWKKKHWSSIYQNYKKSKFFNNFEEFEQIYKNDWEYLIDLNLEIIKFLFKFFNLKKKFNLSSEFSIEAKSNDKITEICKFKNIYNFIVKENTEDYHPSSYFEKKNINLVKINYQKLYENFVKDFDKEIYLDNILDIALVKGPKAFKI